MADAPKKKAGAKARAKADPRITARRIDVQREQGRRRLRIVGALTVASLLVIGAIALTNSPLLDVDEIVVEGTDHTSEDEVVRALTVKPGDALGDVDIALAEEEAEMLPWVESASMSRSWFGTLTLTVVERIPRVAISSPIGFVLVDEGGRQLDVVDAQPPEFLPVAGISASGEVGEPAPVEVQSVLLVLDALDVRTRSDVAQVLVDNRQLYLELVAGGRISLGDDAGLVEKLTSARTVLDQVDLRCLWEIDVRVPTAPAVTRLSADGIPRASLTDLEICS